MIYRWIILAYILVFLYVVATSVSKAIFSRKQDSMSVIKTFALEVGVGLVWPLALLTKEGRKAIFR